MASTLPFALMPDPSAPPLSRLIELVYQGPLENTPFQLLVERLQRVTNASRVSLQLHQPDCVEHDVRVTATHPNSGVDWPSLREVYRSKYMDTDPISIHSLQPGQIVTIADGHGSLLHRDMWMPLQIDYLIRTCCCEIGGLRCWLELVGQRSCGPFDVPRDVRLLEALLPHLTRALQLYSRIMLANSEKIVYAEALDRLAFGSLLLDETGRIVQLSRTVKQLAKKYPDIDLSRRSVVLADHEANKDLQLAIAKASIHRKEGNAKPVELVRMRTRSGALLGLLVVPMPIRTFYQGRNTPNVVIYVSDLDQRLRDITGHQHDVEQLVGKLFGLTKGEAELAVFLADGLVIAEAAEAMGITEGTARCYSKRTFEKMNVNRQPDLIRMIYKSVALLA